jgi:hypothetical protein
MREEDLVSKERKDATREARKWGRDEKEKEREGEKDRKKVPICAN